MTLRKFKQYQPQVDHSAFVDPSAQVIGQVIIGKDSSIWPNVTIRGDVNNISIGEQSNIQDNSVLHVTSPYPGSPENGYPLKMGDRVTIGHQVILHGCKIGNLCLIGMGSCVLDGAVIEDNVLIAAGSLVAQNKRVKSGYLWMGRPAKPIRELTDEELNWLKISADHYVELKDQYLDS
ncbi:MAG: gamma carbonic anhydrase family protein [Gammaproteobacteria bacterium]|nr:gamma carbonic anhydrase family protein [Gammaproteobacteria bacterium]